MFVWPPMPLQPLEDGLDRKLAHSDRLALPMMIAPAAFSFCAMNASLGVLPASAQEPAVVGMPVVSTLSLTMMGIPSSGRSVAVVSRSVGRSCVGEGGRTDGDHRVEHRVELVDAPEIEVRQLDGADPARVHQLLELRDRRRVDVDTGDLRVRRVGRGAARRRGAGYPEHEGQQDREKKGMPKSAPHRVTSTGFGWGGRWDRRRWAAIRGCILQTSLCGTIRGFDSRRLHQGFAFGHLRGEERQLLPRGLRYLSAQSAAEASAGHSRPDPRGRAD